MPPAQNKTATAGGVKTVLMARFSALGDIAMTIPVVYSACRTHPSVRFVMVTRPSMTSIFMAAPANLTVVGADVKEQYAGIRGIAALCRELIAEYAPDIFIDLHNVLRTRLMSIFLGSKGIRTSRIVKPRSARRALTRRHNKLMLPLPSQQIRYREAFEQGGIGITEQFDGLFGGKNAAPVSLFAAITPPKQHGERWVGIAPFAAHEGKIYPPEMMEEVVALINAKAEDDGIRIFLFGGGDKESAILEGWATKYKAATSLAGKKYGFPAELALINHLDVMVAMDSGNMHLAAITSAPTVSIWGATHPYCGFAGWRQSEDNTIQLPLDCRPCSVFGNKPCHRGDHLCMRAIKPRVIFEKINQYLSK